jgi:pyocin large subunit-like protein
MSHQESDLADSDRNTIYGLEIELAFSKKRENQHKKIIDNLKRDNTELNHICNSQELSIDWLTAQVNRLKAQNDQLQAQNDRLNALQAKSAHE